MTMVRVVLGAVVCAALTAPALALAQMPPGPDFTCLCLKQTVDDAGTDMQAKQAAADTSSRITETVRIALLIAGLSLQSHGRASETNRLAAR